MKDALDTFVEQMQEEIFEDTRKTFGETAYRRWRTPLHMGTMDAPDGYAKSKGKCGNMEIFLRFGDERAENALFQTDGCGSDLICGSFAAEAAMGKTADEILRISGKDLLEKMGGLPKENEPAAFHAAKTLRLAARAYKESLSQ